MDNNSTIRLSQAVRKLNVGSTTIVEYLLSKNFAVENNPNVKITPEQYELLEAEFKSNAIEKTDARQIKIGITPSSQEAEKKVKSIESGYTSSESFFNRRRKIEICQSTIQGKNWFLVNSIKYVFLILSIILLITTTKDITIGSVITVYSYVMNFLIALMSAPVAIEMVLRISDVMKRLD